DTSQALATPNPNVDIADRYPAYCLTNESQTHTFTANEYVEVRMVYGAEKDERFDWTRFDVHAPYPTPTYHSPADGKVFTSTNDIKLVWYAAPGGGNRHEVRWASS